jgi:DNA-binding PadR family transcriptional regulator
MVKLGEFELLVLLALLRHGDEPYANRVREAIEERTGRSVSRGALYRTLARLQEKGLLEWEMEPSATPERGGHPMRRLLVTERGIDAAREATLVLRSFLDGLDPILDT